MTAPKRIQRQRTRGWRMPVGAVYVGRGSRWGNPFRWESSSTLAALERGGLAPAYVVESRADAVFMFRKHKRPFNVDLAELRGKDLVCWCAEDQPCHADVLLEWANAPEGGAP